MCRAHPHLMLPLTTSATNRDRHTNRQSWKKGPLFSLTLPLTDTLFCLKERVKVWQQKRKPFDVWSCLSSIQDLMTFDFHEVGRFNVNVEQEKLMAYSSLFESLGVSRPTTMAWEYTTIFDNVLGFSWTSSTPAECFHNFALSPFCWCCCVSLLPFYRLNRKTSPSVRLRGFTLHLLLLLWNAPEQLSRGNSRIDSKRFRKAILALLFISSSQRRTDLIWWKTAVEWVRE